MPRSRRTAFASVSSQRQPGQNRCRALLLVDNTPLRATAWRELITARKGLEKATRDLHRHEQVDDPGFRAWLGSTFPELVTALRELAEKLRVTSLRVDAVEREAWATGRSPRSIWRQWQREAEAFASTEAGDDHDRDTGPRPQDPDTDLFGEPKAGSDYDDSDMEAAFREVCAEQGIDPEDFDMHGTFEQAFGGLFGPPPTPAADNDARSIYRRLVQHLHPDRGGEWTPRRARLWQAVQDAWATRDTDLLARLEAEWEIEADTLNAASPLGRLRAARAEIIAARRDADRKVRLYRKSPSWRFSVAPPDARQREEIRTRLESDRYVLTQNLSRLEVLIAGWERSPKKRGKGGHGRAAPSRTDFSFG